MIFAGFLWMTAGGNDEKVSQAKKTLAAAIVGLALLLAAYAISEFVIGYVQDIGNGANPAGVEP